MARSTLLRMNSRTPNRVALALVAAMACASCATSPEQAPAEAARAAPGHGTFFDPPFVRGIVVDEGGAPVKAKVAVVRENGSSSTSSTGPFTLPAPRSGSATLIATTEDGRLGWTTIHAGDEGPFTLVTDRTGAFLELELGLDDGVRIAVLHGDVRLHDMTLHPGKPKTLVVPAGDIRFGLTEPEPRLREVSMGEGERVRIQLP